MKTKYFKIIVLIPFLIGLGSCKDYLDMPSEADKSEKDVFGTYYNFQGYVDQMYPLVVDPIRNYLTSDGCHGGEAISNTSWATGYKAVRSDYGQIQSRGYYQTNAFTATPNDVGIWATAWYSIRMCNLGLKNFDLLEASQEEKNLIKGQLLFFRAYFHSEILNAWGPIPYINEVLVDDVKKPRYYEYKGKKNFQATTEYIVEDLTEAAQLLPDYWPDPTTQLGRATKLAALSYKAKALIFAGSPLMNENSGGEAVVNKEYMERGAIAADEAIKVAESNPTHYGLVDFKDYQRNFATTDKSVPWTKETVWAQYANIFGRGNYDNRIGRIHTPNSATFGGNAVNNTPTQNYVDKFEMKDGSVYNPAIHDSDNAKRWNFRDPRFRKSIYVDRDTAGAEKKLEMFQGGATIKTDNQLTPYIISKFWPRGVDGKAGTLILNFAYSVPLMRLAEVYLFYAEAANWAYSTDGNNGIVTAPGANYTALGAVNKVRERAGQTPTTATGGAHGNFHTMIMNERAVEMCFEANQYWHDIRRYKIGESLNNTPIYTLDFNKDWTLFQRREIIKRTFEKKHYWMPFPRTLTFMYDGFPQNEGWN